MLVPTDMMTCQECKQELVLDGTTHVGSEVPMRCPACGARYLADARTLLDLTRKGDRYG